MSMGVSQAELERWIESLVDRTAGQLRAELDGLVSQLQDAATARVSGRSVELDAGAAVPPGVPGGAPGPLDAPSAAAALVERIAALDAAESLSDVLDLLADGAARHAGRVLLVVHRDQALTGWRWQGYTSDPKDAAMLEVPLDDEGLLATAVRSGAVAKGSGPAAGHAVQGSHAEDGGAVAVPLAIDGRVVAALYAEAPAGDPETVARIAWAEAVEVLARHAARCLESLTARRLPALVRAAAGAAAIDARTCAPVAAPGAPT